MIEAQFQMPGCTYGTTGYGMMGGSWWFVGWIFMIIFWAAVILAVIWLYRQVRGEAPVKGESAIDVLKKRYASGEITKEEFERIKKELGP